LASNVIKKYKYIVLNKYLVENWISEGQTGHCGGLYETPHNSKKQI